METHNLGSSRVKESRSALDALLDANLGKFTACLLVEALQSSEHSSNGFFEGRRESASDMSRPFATCSATIQKDGNFLQSDQCELLHP
jgi:hypothetical protein